MLASNLSCCTTFLMAVMLEEPDIARFLLEKHTPGNRWVGVEVDWRQKRR